MTLISVALCTFNGEVFLNEQLESFLKQSRLPDELVVCDDGSSDDTVNILRTFAERSSFPVYIHENEMNLGFAKNFERAISLCRGDIIFLSDQDDIWMPEKIGQVSKIFDDRANTDLVFTDAELVSDSGQPLGNDLFDIPFNSPLKTAVANRSLLRLLLFQNHIAGATLAFRKRLLQYLVPFPDSIDELYHDGWIALVAAACDTCEYLDRPLIKYRQHAGQLIGVAARKDEENTKGRIERSLQYAQVYKDRISAILSYFKSNQRLAVCVPAIENSALPILAGLNEKLDHLATRRELPRSAFSRGRLVMSQAFAGKYHRHSNGLRSIIKDLFNLGIIV